LPYAINLAHTFGSRIYLFHVETPSELVMGAPEADPKRYEAEHWTLAKALDELRRSLEMRGVNVTPILTSGMMESELEKAVAENQIDLVVLSTHGRTGIRRIAIGSVADVITHAATCPVLTVGPDVGEEEQMQFRQRILVPSDLSERSTRVLPHVLAIARKFGSSITFLHVIPGSPGVDVHSQPAEAARGSLQGLFGKESGDCNPQFLVQFGDPGKTILRAASENKADLIAMAIKPARLPEVHLHAGLAYRLIAGAPCPVLTCR